MTSVGLRGLAVFTYALAFSYERRGLNKIRREKWLNIAFATRYGKGCTLRDALSLDMRSLADYIEALGKCVEEENKALKSKRR
jgi:hypothetical protein